MALIPLAPYIRELIASANAELHGMVSLLQAVGLSAGAALGILYYSRLARARSYRYMLMHLAACAALLYGCVWLIGSCTIAYSHLASFALLAVWLRLAFRSDNSPALLSLAALVLAGGVGLVDEFLQGLHPQRVCDPVDMLLNLLSAAIGALLLHPFLTSARVDTGTCFEIGTISLGDSGENLKTADWQDTPKADTASE